MMFKVFFLVVLGLASVSEAKTASEVMPAKFYVLFDDGCDHPAEACEVKSKLPAKLKQKKEFRGDAGYRGSLQTEFADKNEAGIDAFEHYFTNRKSCELALKKQDCGSQEGGD